MRPAALLATGLLVLGGCGTEPEAADPGSIPLSTALDLRERCGSAMPDAAPLTETTLAGPAGVELRAGIFEASSAGETALVFLHQTGSGLCGWGRFATEAAAEGVSSVAFDHCGYVDSVCPDDLISDLALQVDLAASYARDELGADRVVVIGASMGGSQTVRAVAGGAAVDAWVDVSGPSAWDDTVLLDVAEDIDVPGLVVFTRTDGPSEYAAAKSLARRSGADFLDGGQGHGWDLVTTIRGRLTPVGRDVLEYATTDRN